jgi:hypothetical protein
MLDYFDTVDKLFAGVLLTIMLLCLTGTGLLATAWYDTFKEMKHKRKKENLEWQQLSYVAHVNGLPAPPPDAQSFWSQQPPST